MDRVSPQYGFSGSDIVRKKTKVPPTLLTFEGLKMLMEEEAQDLRARDNP